MQFEVALREALKYHLLAVVPTLVGGAIAAVALWVGLISPLLATVEQARGGPQALIQSVIATPINVPVLVVGVVLGALIRRIGRTTLLFHIHGTTVVDTMERPAITDETSEEGDSVGGASAKVSSAGDPAATESSTDESGEVDSDHETEATSEDDNEFDDADDETSTRADPGPER